MKALIIILVGAIGLAGCTTMDQYRAGDGRSEGPSSAYSGKSEPPAPRGKYAESHDPYVRDLPRDAETALAKAGIKDMAFLVAVDRHGRARLLKPSNVEYEKVRHRRHIELTGIRPITLLTFKGSHCVMWSDGWMDWMGLRPDNLDEGGEVQTSGGMAGSGEIFCSHWSKD